jgi:hypothetical protein
LPYLFRGYGINLADITAIERIVGDVVEVGTIQAITLDGLGIEIAVWVESDTVFVG